MRAVVRNAGRCEEDDLRVEDEDAVEEEDVDVEVVAS